MNNKRYLTRRQAHEYIRNAGVPITGNSLKDHAHRGTGPKYSFINGRCLYPPEELDAWIAGAAVVCDSHTKKFRPLTNATYESSEEFSAAQDAFRRYISETVNPVRAKYKLEQISDTAARECFRILLDGKWNAVSEEAK